MKTHRRVHRDGQDSGVSNLVDLRKSVGAGNIESIP
jgi:hypothetical protein